MIFFTQSGQFQPTPLMRGATSAKIDSTGVLPISTHAPHARSDKANFDSIRKPKDFNPRPSCEERLITLYSGTPGADFNPRPSCEERLRASASMSSFRYFNPRPSCEERRLFPGSCFHAIAISTHAPHARSDKNHKEEFSCDLKFQPTPLMRGATAVSAGEDVAFTISTHAPHARSDLF